MNTMNSSRTNKRHHYWRLADDRRNYIMGLGRLVETEKFPLL